MTNDEITAVVSAAPRFVFGLPCWCRIAPPSATDIHGDPCQRLREATGYQRKIPATADVAPVVPPPDDELRQHPLAPEWLSYTFEALVGAVADALREKPPAVPADGARAAEPYEAYMPPDKDPENPAREAVGHARVALDLLATMVRVSPGAHVDDCTCSAHRAMSSVSKSISAAIRASDELQQLRKGLAAISMPEETIYYSPEDDLDRLRRKLTYAHDLFGKVDRFLDEEGAPRTGARTPAEAEHRIHHDLTLIERIRRLLEDVRAAPKAEEVPS